MHVPNGQQQEENRLPKYICCIVFCTLSCCNLAAMILLVEYRLHTRPKMRKAPLSLSYLVVLASSPNNQQCAKKLQKIVQHYLGCFPAILQKTVPDMQSVPLVCLFPWQMWYIIKVISIPISLIWRWNVLFFVLCTAFIDQLCYLHSGQKGR